MQATIARVFGSTPAAKPAPPEEVPLTAEEIPALWKGLTPKVRPVLVEMATKPDGYPYAELRQKLGLEAPQIAGRLSSIGHNMRKQFRGRLHPVDSRSGQYRLHPNFAEYIRRTQSD